MLFFFEKKIKLQDLNKLLYEILNKLPKRYKTYKDQIENGIIKNILFKIGPTKNYITFSFREDVVDFYEDKKERGFSIKNISIFDKNFKKNIFIDIYFYCNLVIGIDSSSNLNKCKFDYDTVDISQIKINFDEISEKLKKELKLLHINSFNINDIYEITVDNDQFIHLMELEDGDCLIVNQEGFFVVDIGNQEIVKILKKYEETLKNNLLNIPVGEIYSYTSNID